jgi:hypothetical protein
MNEQTKAMLGIGFRHGLSGTGVGAIIEGLNSGNMYAAGAGVLGVLISFGLSYANKKATGALQ